MALDGHSESLLSDSFARPQRAFLRTENFPSNFIAAKLIINHRSCKRLIRWKINKYLGFWRVRSSSAHSMLQKIELSRLVLNCFVAGEWLNFWNFKIKINNPTDEDWKLQSVRPVPALWLLCKPSAERLANRDSLMETLFQSPQRAIALRRAEPLQQMSLFGGKRFLINLMKNYVLAQTQTVLTLKL